MRSSVAGSEIRARIRAHVDSFPRLKPPEIAGLEQRMETQGREAMDARRFLHGRRDPNLPPLPPMSDAALREKEAR